MPVYIYCKIVRRAGDPVLLDHAFEQRYGAFYENLKVKDADCLKFNMYFVMRRFLVVSAVVFIDMNNLCAVVVFVVTGVMQTGYVMANKPFHVKHQMRMEIANEWLSLAVAYMFLTLARISEQGIFITDKNGRISLQVGDLQMELFIGDWIVRVIIFQIFANLLDIFYYMILESY